MNSLSPSSDVPPADPWRSIDDALDCIVQLAATQRSRAEFHEAVLQQVVTSLAAAGGTIWIETSGRLQVSCELQPAGGVLKPSSPEHAAAARLAHGRLMLEVMASGQSRIVAPGMKTESADAGSNPTQFILLLCPWPRAGATAGLIEVFQQAGTAPDATGAQLRFLEAVAELVADFDRNQQLLKLQQREFESGNVEQFYRKIHAKLDRSATAFHIANDGRRLLGCDRVSVVQKRGSRCRLLAASGVDVINRRANSVRKLESLAAATLGNGAEIWYGKEPLNLPPQIEDRLHDYIDESQARQLAIVPLEVTDDAEQRHIVGALVIENFSAASVESLSERVGLVAPQSGLALRNAMQFERVPRWLRALCAAGWILRAKQLPKTIAVVLVLAAIAALLVLVPADFEIEARGQLQPELRNDVFAPADGVVLAPGTADRDAGADGMDQGLQLKHGQAVQKGDVLLELKNPDLELEYRKILGELRTSIKRRNALEAERLKNMRQTRGEEQRYAQIIQELQEIAPIVDGLERQKNILLEQQSELSVKSPISGQIITWDVAKLLDTRPVRRGQVLLTVARTDGTWVLELDLPDDDVGHILAAQDELKKDLQVTYQLATEPGVQRHGRVQSIAMATDINSSDEPVIRVIVKLDDEMIAERRPGATVRAKLYCGRRSIGFVWFHDMYDYIRTWLLF